MKYTRFPELYPEEQKMPLAKYYYIPLAAPGPLSRALLELGPCDPARAVMPEHMADLIDVERYAEMPYGYCMLPNGAGYVAFYVDYGPNVTPEMLSWYWRWVNIPPKGTVPGHGNLKYKILHQIDHLDHRFVNGVDYADGVYTLETLDNGAGEMAVGSYHHGYKLDQYGVPAEKLQAIQEAGGSTSGIYETFDIPGTHLCMNVTRISRRGTTERVSWEWIGYKPVDGRFVRDPSTPVDEQYLRNVLIHNEIEHTRMAQILPDLYREYHDKPEDAD